MIESPRQQTQDAPPSHFGHAVHPGRLFRRDRQHRRLKSPMNNSGNRRWRSPLSPQHSPSIELDGAKQVALEIGARHELVHTDQLEIPAFVQNDAARCFHCKTDLYQLLDGLREPRASKWIADGTNLDDLGDDRPGIKAAREWGIRSPLIEASLSKSDVRALAHMLGLSNWNKPAAACLSSRIPRAIAGYTIKSSARWKKNPKIFCMLKAFTICAYGSMERWSRSRSERRIFPGSITRTCAHTSAPVCARVRVSFYLCRFRRI